MMSADTLVPIASSHLYMSHSVVGVDEHDQRFRTAVGRVGDMTGGQASAHGPTPRYLGEMASESAQCRLLMLLSVGTVTASVFPVFPCHHRVVTTVPVCRRCTDPTFFLVPSASDCQPQWVRTCPSAIEQWRARRIFNVYWGVSTTPVPKYFNYFINDARHQQHPQRSKWPEGQRRARADPPGTGRRCDRPVRAHARTGPQGGGRGPDGHCGLTCTSHLSSCGIADVQEMWNTPTVRRGRCEGANRRRTTSLSSTRSLSHHRARPRRSGQRRLTPAVSLRLSHARRTSGL